MKKITAEELVCKARYLYEIANFLEIDKRTLHAWLTDIEGIDIKKDRKLLTPHEVKIILKHFT
ncbi:MAG: hypothetical protein U0L93_05900 [Bacteroidales bacterium]|nr:hypothetical protein [Bacteroidales bacterium]